MSDVDNSSPHDNRQLEASDLIEAARRLWGRETKRGKTEWRFGTHGSKIIYLDDNPGWQDFETGEKGPLIDLCRRAGINGVYSSNGATPATRPERQRQERWQPLPPPGPAPLNMLACNKLYTYRAAGGEITHYVKRFEPKDFRPLTYGLHNGTAGWHAKAPLPPLPLYGLDLLHELDPELVILCEGEKAADAANHKITEEGLPWIAMSWYGGSGRAKDADVSPLRQVLRTGRKVLIWPDADEPGLTARNTLLDMIEGAATLNVEGLPEHFDAADLRAGETMKNFVETRMPARAPEGSPQNQNQPPPSTSPPPPGPAHANIAEWDHIPTPQPQWSVPELIPLKQVTLFSGEGAVGKSTIALHLAAATVLGLGWLSWVPNKGPAFFIDAEDDIDIIHWRLDKICKLYGVTFTNLANEGLRIWSLAGQDALFTSADKNKGIIRPTYLYNFFLDQAAKIKPKIIVIASSANIFSGNENDRPQVTFFVNLLKAMAIAAEGSVVLVSHPSLQGINSGTGLSGSTQWHNAARARIVLHSSEASPDLRELEFQKNQYGRLAEKITLEWRDGMYLVKPGLNNMEKAAAEMKAEEIFLYLLRARSNSGRHLSDRPQSRHYAPKVFATDQTAFEAKLKKEDLEAAMERLFTKKTIKVEPYGPPSDKTSHIALA